MAVPPVSQPVNVLALKYFVCATILASLTVASMALTANNLNIVILYITETTSTLNSIYTPYNKLKKMMRRYFE